MFFETSSFVVIHILIFSEASVEELNTLNSKKYYKRAYANCIVIETRQSLKQI